MSKRYDRVHEFLTLFVRPNRIPEGTPRRVLRGFQELLSGYEQDPEAILSQAIFQAGGEDSGTVQVQSIPFYSLCEHHFLPFFGTVDIAYIPSRALLGLSKLPRLVECLSKRLQLQERLGREIATALYEHPALKPLQVCVTIKARHLCMMSRGAKASGLTKTRFEIPPGGVDRTGWP